MKKDGEDHHDPNRSHHEVIEHPNLEDENAPVLGNQASTADKKEGCGKILKRLDLLIIKPLLIYNYEKDSHKKQKLFNELLMMEGTKLE